MNLLVADPWRTPPANLGAICVVVLLCLRFRGSAFGASARLDSGEHIRRQVPQRQALHLMKKKWGDLFGGDAAEVPTLLRRQSLSWFRSA
jgi:hypothetical protein